MMPLPTRSHAATQPLTDAIVQFTSTTGRVPLPVPRAAPDVEHQTADDDDPHAEECR